LPNYVYYYVLFSVVSVESTPEDCIFPVLQSALGSLVGNLHAYLHSLEIDKDPVVGKFSKAYSCKDFTKMHIPRSSCPDEIDKFLPCRIITCGII
jgi:hypothetical protein